MAEVNAGLGNLAELKQFLLARSMSGLTDTANDATLTAIGLGVAGMFAAHCNRDWSYGAANVDEFTANRSFAVARRYPVNMDVVPTMELCTQITNGAKVWTPVTDPFLNIAEDRGMFYLGGYQGNYLSRIRITSAGGYWWLGLDAETALPTGAAAVPNELKLAWLLQCQALWLVRDDLGIAVAGSSGGSALLGLSLPGYDLVPEVRSLLKDFIRYAIMG